MSKNNAKSLGAMRQKLRKYIKDFDDDMAKFRENPDEPDDEVTKWVEAGHFPNECPGLCDIDQGIH